LVIGSAGSPEYAQLVTVQHVERLLATLAASYEAVIIDVGSTLDERALAVFELAECIVIPFIAELGALRAVRTMLDYLNDTGASGVCCAAARDRVGRELNRSVGPVASSG